ncbi:alpha-L-arabinofuranosidase C-terminal domain-containing protein [Collinsella intestinalis]|uniref:alpha-L-arabinofuranosidase C-terminal domain-containing protein n=1 Tax=Collinsella intestinalis TaxID=147207 RepID=UPI00195E12CB|nr:alpha-L-arabinofuranosidase C-terminal domain-containing protein [Collinsella intestinalis]MBM6942184.1 hypothetical protein [Collinsella intestinalis]
MALLLGTLAVFATNRSQDAPAAFEVTVPGTAETVEATTLHDSDPLAANTLNDRERVAPYANDSAALDAASGTVRVTLPPISWTVLHIR